MRLSQGEGVIALSVLGQHLTETSGFDPRALGCRTLKELVGALELIELILEDDVPMVRLRRAGITKPDAG
jgi:hypothetical protein